jgi:5-deoxy-glucuronate isomerase
MALISENRDGFPNGFTAITSRLDSIGVDFSILRMKAGTVYSTVTKGELALLLMNGKVEMRWKHKAEDSSEALVEIPVTASRRSLFEEGPTTLHVPNRTAVHLQALQDCELAVIGADNGDSFDTQLITADQVLPEYRGKGLVQNTCLRSVRAIFDHSTRPQSKLVVGEVVNYPGRWSSYPPHHHAQPEIYHYRFTLPQGYGHGEEGDDVYKIRNCDTMTIHGGRDHAQVSAPGYGMYYLWIVRHLENNPYVGFEYTEEHRWILNPENQGWEPPL